MGQDAHKLFILDTNVLLHDPLSIYSFNEHDVIIPMTVLEELDRIKDRKKDVSRDARVAIRALEDVFKDATPEEIIAGIPLAGVRDIPNLGRIAIFTDHNLKEDQQTFTDDGADNRIINAALYLQGHEKKRQVVLVTKDINMRLKAKGAGLKFVEDYRSDQLIDDIRLLTKGFVEIEGNFWDKIGECESETVGRETSHRVKGDVFDMPHVNQYLFDQKTEFAGSHY